MALKSLQCALGLSEAYFQCCWERCGKGEADCHFLSVTQIYSLSQRDWGITQQLQRSNAGDWHCYNNGTL